MPAPATPTPRPTLARGTRVEVRSGFDGSWSKGFTVARVDDGGYRLRRSSDGSVLPKVFAKDDVRRERRQSMWWI